VSVIRVWAPEAQQVRVVTGASREQAVTADLVAAGGGWWAGPDLPAGTRYAFLLDDSEEPLPDPASRWQPDGVHLASRVYDESGYAWRDHDWAGRDLTSAVVYEVHIGTFTPGATFDAAIERLDHLVTLGITHVELLPVNAFNGTWNWGYDGVCWFAVHEPYGGPDGLKRFVDACHARGLAVLLDVVHNHLGPSGNYLPRFGPYLRTGRSTWGDLVNFDEPAVRRFVIDNALMWLRDYHADGLRLDAVHALQDRSPEHVLAQMSAEVDALAAELGRPLTLIGESDLNDPVVISPRDEGGWGLAAQWDDDVHHALHALLSGERQGYYADFGSLPCLAKVLTSAFFHDGTYSTFRGREHGAPVDRERTPGWRFVVCLQNHDQIGNRAVGDRLPELLSPGLLGVGAVVLLTSAFTPMLWMGEEWAATTRWPFFTSHPEPALAAAVGAGRVAEFAEHGWDVSQLIDPQDPAAYRSAILDWTEPARPGHAEMLGLYRRLIALRAAEPDLRDGDLSRMRVEFSEDERWVIVHRGAFRVVANLADVARTVAGIDGSVVLSTAQVSLEPDGIRLPPESAAIVRASGSFVR
jgi:maltooligosyltrehalose trehalohydrolase